MSQRWNKYFNEPFNLMIYEFLVILVKLNLNFEIKCPSKDNIKSPKQLNKLSKNECPKRDLF